MAVVNAGRFEQVDTPLALFHRPASEFVARFMGQTNVLKGKIASINGRETQVTAQGLTFVVTAQDKLMVGDDVVFVRSSGTSPSRVCSDGSDRSTVDPRCISGNDGSLHVRSAGGTRVERFGTCILRSAPCDRSACRLGLDKRCRNPSRSLVGAQYFEMSIRARSPWLLLISPVVVIVVLPFFASLVLMTGFGFSASKSIGLDVWVRFLIDPFSWKVIWTTLWLAARVTFFCLLIGYPIAFALNNLKSPLWRGIAFTILFAPLLMSVIVRAYGWIVLLSGQGLVNSLFGLAGLGPFRLMLNDFGALIAMVHVMLPFTVLPLLSSINQLPPSGIEAARDLGASPVQVFVRVVAPLTLPGILSAIEIVFSLAASAFVTPSILGGGRVLTLPRLIYDNIGSLDWALAAVQSFTLLSITVLVLFGLRRVGQIFRYEGVSR